MQIYFSTASALRYYRIQQKGLPLRVLKKRGVSGMEFYWTGYARRLQTLF